MRWTTEEQSAIREHAAVLGISTQEYVRQSASSRALDWQRQRDAFREMARRRGTSVEQFLERGMLTDDIA
ncbi:plasmid mobilization protein [Streptomyces flaveus]|uniref:plasmid mobilization protein n=1 Tax=Streptomyces flaveus TaxID=66370 RepID=UPI00332E100D